jgi:hypothetical protein
MLDWAFSANGDPATGVALTIAAVPLSVQLSLMGECHGRVERSLARLDSDSAEAARSRMKLCAALGWSLMAEQLDETGYQLRALWGLWVDHLNNGEFRTALEGARQFCRIVANSSSNH